MPKSFCFVINVWCVLGIRPLLDVQETREPCPEAKLVEENTFEVDAGVFQAGCGRVIV